MEKREEKEEKEEKEKEEKSWDEKYRRDPLSAIVWPAILIWAGLVLLANTTGFLDQWLKRASDTPGWQFLAGAQTWGLILIGAGLILLGEVVVRLLAPAYRRPVTGSLILAAALLAWGVGNLIQRDIVWPLVLVAVGLAILLRGFFRRQ
jgi:hypothetical protein